MSAVVLRARAVVKHFPLRSGRAGGGLGRGLGGGLGRLRRPTVHAVNGVDLDVHEAETVGIVGESGCGKSTLARCLTRLVEPTSGRIEFEDTDITHASRRALLPVRARLQMVFQDPYSSLNPRRRVEEILAEPLRVHHRGSAREIAARVDDLLELVGLPAVAGARYPREFSGGQRQRIGIARALALEPRVIVADEPVSALDVSIQAQVLNLFADLQRRLGLTYVFIAHDLGVVRHVSDRVAVMYLGRIVELADNEDLYVAPAHPYTEVLLSAIPDVDDGTGPAPARDRVVVKGDVPDPIELPTGCAFASRCRYAQDVCRTTTPPLEPVGDGTRSVACHFPLVAKMRSGQEPLTAGTA